MLLKEMTETKLKNIALERASYDLMQSQDFMVHFQRENDNLKQEIAQLTKQNEGNSDLYKAAKIIAMQSERSGYLFSFI